jgi:hypothetical protein
MATDRRIILTLGPETSERMNSGGLTAGYTAGKFGVIQTYNNVEESAENNFELIRVDPLLPKEIFTDRSSNIVVGDATAGYRWMIVDPNPPLVYDLLTLNPPLNPLDGDMWTVSFGGVNVTSGAVCKGLVVNSVFNPNQVVLPDAWGTIKAGHSIVFGFDAYVGEWRCLSINKTDS